MNTPHPESATRLIPTAVGLMYARATSVGISRLVRAGDGFNDDDNADDGTSTRPAGDHSESQTPELSVSGHLVDSRSSGDHLTADDSAGDPLVIAANHHLDQLTGQLDDYFDGRLRDFTIPVDWAGAGVADEFAREVYREIQHIPYGETDSYGQISIDAGRPRNARRVGRLCSLVPVSFLIPVHRVTRADGGLGSCPEFRRGLLAHEKRNINSAEPVAITPA